MKKENTWSNWIIGHCETVIHLTIVTIKDFKGKHRKLNSYKKQTIKTSLNSFNKDSAFLSNQRPDTATGNYFH